ncbi:MAG: hypothetical protein IT541_09620 [Hyphomicrobiales bacterium]|nr:hypothetical protein [Hyphomicrobiales bacterium]
MTDNAMDMRSGEGPCTLRFKFMPTPSAPLHVGHAWLLFVMDALVAQANRQGRSAEIILVIDRLMAGIQGLDEQRMNSNTNSIIQDIDQLGIRLGAVAFNDRAAQAVERCRRDPGFCDAVAMLPASLIPPYYFSLCSPNYFISNAILDAALGITHILRGADQFHHFGIYRNVYALLGITPPLLMYLPLILNEGMSKISSGSGFILSEMLQRISPEELFCRLVQACVKRAEDKPLPIHREEATEILLGDEGDFLLDFIDGNAAKRSGFLAGLVPQPVICLDSSA